MVKNGGARFFLAALALAMASAAQAAETVTYSYDVLGRLVATTSSGTVNNGVTTQLGYDPAGNRSTYTVTGAGGAPPSGGGGGGGGGGSPPPSGNQPPVANPDTAPSIPKCGTAIVNVTANDTDPEGNYPLAVTGATAGAALVVEVLDSNRLSITSVGASGLKSFGYTVRDSLGATATGSGSITVTTVNACS